jgi:TonB family protein
MAGVSLTSLSELFEGDEALLRARRLAPNDDRILDSIAMLYAPIYGGRGMAGMNPAFAAHVRDEMNSTSDIALARMVRQRAMGGAGSNLTPLHRVNPVYPSLAKQARIQGTVRFNAIVGKDGSIKNLTLVSGHPLLVQPAQEAARQWRYQPTLLNGEPAEVQTQIDLNFTLADGGQGAGVGGGVPGGVPGGVVGGVIGPVQIMDPNRPKRITVGGQVQESQIVNKVQPIYPPLAKQARIQGTVRFNVVIGPEGNVLSSNVISGHPLLVEAASDAVRQWRYRPTLLNGQPVEVATIVDVNFTLLP